MSKFDKGKPPVQLIEPKFLLDLADILGFGAEKYGPNDWKNNIPEDVVERTYGSIQRHLLFWKSGQIFDKESNMNHLLHAACQIMMLYWYTGMKEKNDELRSKETLSTVQKTTQAKTSTKRN